MKNKLFLNAVLETVYLIASFLVILVIDNFYCLSNSEYVYYAYGAIFIFLLVIILVLGFCFSRFFIALFEFFLQAYLSSQVNYFEIRNQYYSFNINTLFKYCDINFLTLLIIAVNIMFAVLYLFYEYNRKFEIKIASYRIFAVGLMAFVVLILSYQEKKITYPRYYYDFQINTDSYYSWLHYDTMSRECVRNYGIYNFLIKDLESISDNRYKEKDMNDVDLYISNKTHNDNDYTGIFEGRNVLFIQASNFSFDQLNDNTPALNRLIKKGIVFTNFNTPHLNGKMSDVEFMTNLSIVPDTSMDYSCYRYDDNYYPATLANSFKSNGYTTDFFFYDYKVYFNREKMADVYGYDRFMDMEALYSGTKLTDKKIFDWYRYYLWTNKCENQKYMAYIVTDEESDLKDLDDQLYELLYNDLNAKDLVIVLFGNGNKAEGDDSDSGLVIYGDGASHGKNKKQGLLADILPTVNSMFELGQNYSLMVGDDLFDDGYEGTKYLDNLYSHQEKIKLSISSKILKYDYFRKYQ